MLLQLMVLLITLVIILVPGMFYLLTIPKTLNVISPLSRMMRPGQVWLLLIPIFNIVWHFVMVGRLSNSIKNECMRLHIRLEEADPAYVPGVGCMCLFLVAVVLNATNLLPVLGSLFNLGGFIVWIIYWIRIVKYKNLILANQDNFLLDAEREASGAIEP